MNTTDNEGNTPLHVVATCRNRRAFLALIARGADISLVNNNQELATINSDQEVPTSQSNDGSCWGGAGYLHADSENPSYESCSPSRHRPILTAAKQPLFTSRFSRLGEHIPHRNVVLFVTWSVFRHRVLPQYDSNPFSCIYFSPHGSELHQYWSRASTGLAEIQHAVVGRLATCVD